MPGLVIGGTGHYVGEGWVGSGDGASGPVDLTLQSSAAVASGTLDVKAATDVVLTASAGVATASATVLAATDIVMQAGAGVATATGDVKAATDVLLAAATAAGSGSLALQAGEQEAPPPDRMRDGLGE